MRNHQLLAKWGQCLFGELERVREASEHILYGRWGRKVGGGSSADEMMNWQWGLNRSLMEKPGNSEPQLYQHSYLVFTPLYPCLCKVGDYKVWGFMLLLWKCCTPIAQGYQTHFYHGPHQTHGCLQRAEYNFRTV